MSAQSSDGVSHADARESAMRFINAWYGNAGAKPQARIPADPNDDDLRLLRYIDDSEATRARVAELEAQNSKGAEAMGAIRLLAHRLNLSGPEWSEEPGFGPLVTGAWMDYSGKVEARVAELEARERRARQEGRAEALQLLLGACAETFPDKYLRSSPMGETGDYSTDWDDKKLRELLEVEAVESLVERLEAHVLETGADRDSWAEQADQRVTDVLERVARAEKAEARVAELEAELERERRGTPAEQPLHDEPMNRQIVLLNRRVGALSADLAAAQEIATVYGDAAEASQADAATLREAWARMEAAEILPRRGQLLDEASLNDGRMSDHGSAIERMREAVSAPSPGTAILARLRQAEADVAALRRMLRPHLTENEWTALLGTPSPGAGLLQELAHLQKAALNAVHAMDRAKKLLRASGLMVGPGTITDPYNAALEGLRGLLAPTATTDSTPTP